MPTFFFVTDAGLGGSISLLSGSAADNAGTSIGPHRTGVNAFLPELLPTVPNYVAIHMVLRSPYFLADCFLSQPQETQMTDTLKQLEMKRDAAQAAFRHASATQGYRADLEYAFSVAHEAWLRALTAAKGV